MMGTRMMQKEIMNEISNRVVHNSCTLNSNRHKRQNKAVYYIVYECICNNSRRRWLNGRGVKRQNKTKQQQKTQVTELGGFNL